VDSIREVTGTVPSSIPGLLPDAHNAPADPVRPRVTVRLFGGFRLLKDDRPLKLRAGGKGALLLVNLALRLRDGIEREELLTLLWPASDENLATQSLHSLTHALRRAVGDALGGDPPVVHREGRLRLNTERGISVDVEEFEARVATGDRLRRDGRDDEAMPCYEEAVGLYEGDLVLGSEIRHLLERERLRARYLSLLARIAENRFAAEDYAAANARAIELLAADPCREDAHRMVMRCSVRLGQRAQALRQFQICSEILRREFEVEPEPATRDLYELVRLVPAGI
jgi:DNA-binding SARP family transcriptional activator